MAANPLVEKNLKSFKSEIDKLLDKDAKDALLEVHGKLTETYELRAEAAEHAEAFGSLEADLAAADDACAKADAAVFKKKMYGDFSLGELFEGWKTDPVPEKIARITKPKVRETLAAARAGVQAAFENLQDYFNQDVDPSPRLATRLGTAGTSLLARLDRLDERIRSLDALG